MFKYGDDLRQDQLVLQMINYMDSLLKKIHLDYETEVTSLKEYKLDSENKAKKAIIDKYSEQLDKSVINEFTENMGNYTIDALKKELAFALVGENPETFSKVSTPRVPKVGEPSGLEAVLDQYKK